MFKNFTQKLTNYSLNKKIFAIVLLSNILILSVLLCGYFLLTRTTNRLIYQTTADSLSSSSAKLYYKLTNIESVSASISTDKALQSLLASVKNNTARYETHSEVYNRLESYYQQFRDNHIAYIMLVNDSFTANTYIKDSDMPPQNLLDELVDLSKNKYGKAQWCTSYSKKYGLFLTREIRRIENAQFDTLGTLIINVDAKALISSSSYYSSQYSNPSFLLCDDTEIIETSSQLSKMDLQKLSKNFSSPYSVMALDNGKFFVVKNQIPGFQWYFYILVPYSDIYSSVEIARFLFLTSIFLSLGFAILFSKYFIGNLTIHFDNLIKKFHSFQDKTHAASKPETSYDYSQRKDELGIIHQQFDAMAARIDELINVNYRNELLVKDAQIKALETQINPHFLYNTLESINWRAKASNEHEISLMVESLGTLMRASLSQTNKTFSIRQELEFLNSYIAIQQLRFEEQLIFTLKTDESIMNVEIPKLTIQPLVENAIHYALEESTEECHISVILSHDVNHIYIDVKNSGSTLEDNLLNKLYDHRIKPNGFGIGLMNIDQRLKLTFGPSYGLTLFNKENFAIARITLPYKGKEKFYA